MKIYVLGTAYEVIKQAPCPDPKMDGADGYIEKYAKRIVLDDFADDPLTVEDSDARKREVLRHEIIHAFLYESGLNVESWGANEEIVDWIAVQLPKMAATMRDARCLD